MALKRNRRPGDIFNMSFLDIICCGFGAMVLLVLLSNTDVLSGALTAERVRGMLGDISAAQEMRDQAQTRRDELQTERAQLEAQLRELAEAPADTLPELQAQIANMRARADALRNEVDALSRAEVKVETVEAVDVGGISVGSDYIIFIIDNSGSMTAEKVWERVIAQLENILDIHPQVKGFQIMSNDEEYLFGATAKRWIPDTPDERKKALAKMRKWRGHESSPLQGLEKAINTYAPRTDSLAIYIFGDDYSGRCADFAVKEITDANRDPETGEPRARIHGVGFLHQIRVPGLGFLGSAGSVQGNRFATLMREVARRNRGAFVGLALEQPVAFGKIHRNDCRLQ